MRRLAAALACAGWMLCASAQGQTLDEQAEIVRAVAVGRELYEHDRAAWLATDALRHRHPNLQRLGLRGWVTERVGEDVVVTFVRENNGALASLYRAVYRDERLTQAVEVQAPLTEAQTRLFQARRFGQILPPQACSEHYNTVVLPRAPSSDSAVDVDVYLIPASTKENVIMVGGFFRLGVDADTETLNEIQIFTHTCLTLEKGRNTAALAMTHLTSGTPPETLVFLSLSHRVPLFVSTSTGIWEVNGEAVRRMERDE